MPDDEALHAAAHSVVAEFGMERPDMVQNPRNWLVAESPGGPLAQPQSEALGGAAPCLRGSLHVYSQIAGRVPRRIAGSGRRRLTGDLVGTNELSLPQLREEKIKYS